MERKKRILIVDDDHEVQLPGMVETAQSVLGVRGWEVLWTDNAEGAYKIIDQSTDLDIAVIDLYLSDPPLLKEGLDLLREVKGKFQNCCRILVSSRLRDLAEVDNDPNLYDEFFPLTRQNGKNPYDGLAALLSRRTGVRPSATVAAGR